MRSEWKRKNVFRILRRESVLNFLPVSHRCGREIMTERRVFAGTEVF